MRQTRPLRVLRKAFDSPSVRRVRYTLKGIGSMRSLRARVDTRPHHRSVMVNWPRSNHSEIGRRGPFSPQVPDLPSGNPRLPQ